MNPNLEMLIILSHTVTIKRFTYHFKFSLP